MTPLNFGQPSQAGPIDFEIIIDGGSSVNIFDTELKWSNNNSSFSPIDNKSHMSSKIQ